MFLNKDRDTQLKGQRAADERVHVSVRLRLNIVELCDWFSKHQYSEGERLKTVSLKVKEGHVGVDGLHEDYYTTSLQLS